MDKIKRIQRTFKYSNTCLYSGSTNISVMLLNLKSQFAYTICGRTCVVYNVMYVANNDVCS